MPRIVAKASVPVLLVLAIAAALTVGIAITMSPTAGARQVGPTESEAEAMVSRLVTPAALAVAGLTVQQAQAMIEAVAGDNTQAIATLASRRGAAESYAEQLAAAEETLFRGGATTERLAAREAAQSGFDAARGDVDAARAQLRAAIYDEIGSLAGSENSALAARWSANVLRKVPDAFKPLDLSAEAWRTLEAAWRRTERGEELTPAQSTAMTAAQSSSVVALAHQRLTLNLAALSEWAAGAATP